MSDLRNQVDNLYRTVRDLFDYVRDQDQFKRREDWRSHFTEANKGLRFKDDCDGFAWTMLDILSNAEVDKELLEVRTCYVEPHWVKGKWIEDLRKRGHMVCAVQLEDDT